MPSWPFSYWEQALSIEPKDGTGRQGECPRLSPPGLVNSGPPVAADADAQNIAEKITNFLGKLAPGGTTEAAGRERNYVVSFQVDFIRKTPNQQSPEESLSYQKLRERDLDVMPPYVYYGETVVGKYDPALPGVIAVRANIEGKEVSGYVDAQKLWLEPPLDRAQSERYMAVAESAAVRVVPDPSSPPVLMILQGEVVDAIGQLEFQGRKWVKARFNAPEPAALRIHSGNRDAAFGLCHRQSVGGDHGGGSQADSQFEADVFR